MCLIPIKKFDLKANYLASVACNTCLEPGGKKQALKTSISVEISFVCFKKVSSLICA